MTLYKLLQGDCTKILYELEAQSVDLVVADPPYHIGDKTKLTKVGEKITSTNEAWGHWEKQTWTQYDEMIKKALSGILRVLKPGGSAYIWLGRERVGYYWKYLEDKGFTPNNCIIWVKTNPVPHFRKTNYRSGYEECIYFSRGKPKTFNFLSQKEMVNVFYAPIGTKETEHPTEKPLHLIKWHLKVSSTRGDVVLDPFMGSGTTMKAAQELGRSCIGVELNPEYIEIIKKRCYGITFLDRPVIYDFPEVIQPRAHQNIFSEVTHEVLNDKSLRASKDRRIKQLKKPNKDRSKRTTI